MLDMEVASGERSGTPSDLQITWGPYVAIFDAPGLERLLPYWSKRG